MDIPSIQETASVWLLHCRSRHHREPTPVLEARKWDRARVVNRAVRHRHRTAAPATWNLPVVAQLGGTGTGPGANAGGCFMQSSNPLPGPPAARTKQASFQASYFCNTTRPERRAATRLRENKRQARPSYLTTTSRKLLSVPRCGDRDPGGPPRTQARQGLSDAIASPFCS